MIRISKTKLFGLVSAGLLALTSCAGSRQTAAPTTPHAAPSWPAAQIRIARPTDKLEEVVRFYREGLGLKVLGSFTGHAGYDGVMLGMPDASVHLEFTRHAQGSPGQAPTRDNLLVLYIPDRGARAQMAERLATMGYPEVEPENPYWKGRSTTIADPDGWRVVLFDGVYAASGAEQAKHD